MYVTTFYSFKGGVGRTMALVNVAVELAQRGRRVLAVDFDLEAPGLDTFKVFRSRKKRSGIVDFVTEYLEAGRAPAVDHFVHESKGVGEKDGCLWVMPSGEQHGRYPTSFREIDWLDLYERRDGYLLFEDLRAQWEQVVKPDYVLIDSRTGHTDTGGICTRQLPDAVAILFFPNDQNLRGLTTVVRDIRAEAGNGRRKEIELHFVMSNVPDLDDEDRVLERKIDAFRKDLAFTGEPLVLHRYDSLSLLNQVIYTTDRPRSRLAKEYHQLVHEIVRRNLADRDGALDYIRQAGRRWRGRDAGYESPLKVNATLDEIENAHSGDGEVLFMLGEFLDEDHQSSRAASLFDRAVEAGYREPRALLRRARMRADGDDPDGARKDALEVLQFENLSPPLVRDAVLLVGVDQPADIAESRAIASLRTEALDWLINELAGSLDEINVALSIVDFALSRTRGGRSPASPATDGLPSGRAFDALQASIAGLYVGIGSFRRAVKVLRREGREFSDMDPESAFNCGMAMWGETGEVVSEPFVRVVEVEQEFPKRDAGPHHLQRMAVACWAAGDLPKAVDFAQRARRAVRGHHGSLLSCWRYRRVPIAEFLADLDEIDALIGGDASRRPRFISESAAPGSSD